MNYEKSFDYAYDKLEKQRNLFFRNFFNSHR